MGSGFRGAGRIEMRPVSALKGYERNARKHGAKQIEKIADSILAFGFNAPILVDATGVIIAGHGRLEGAKLAGLKEVPVVELGHLTDAERRAYILADNRLAEEATWDEDLLAEEIAALQADALDLTLTGFDVPQLDALLDRLDGEGGADDAPAPEPPALPVSRLGDLWRLGKHRVLCGDATSAEAVARLLAGVEPHLMVTDPPYGVNYDPSWRLEKNVTTSRKRSNGKPVKSTFAALGEVSNDHRADWREAWALFPGDVAYVWHGGCHGTTVHLSLEAAGFEIRAQIIWNKPHFALGRGDYHWQHEPCWYAVRKGSAGGWAGDRKQSTIWSITGGMGFTTKTEGPDARTGHSTQKPVECMARPIRNNSSPGQAVYDPFLGSGTTVIAAERERRVAYGLELDPAYVDVIVRRWQEIAGAEAVLDGDGRTFAAIAAERGRAAA